MASIQEIVARRSPVTSLPQASPNPNVGVGLISDAGSAGFRQLGQVRGISLDTATGFGQAMATDAQTVGMVGQAVDEITTAVDKLNETNEKTRLSNAISFADAKLKEWNSISDPELKNEFELKQLRPAYNAISSERESLKPIALNARNILDSEKNVLLNADLANKSTSSSMVELFKLEENIRKAKDLNEFSAGSQRYTSHVYGMLDSGLLTVAQSTSIMTRSRSFLRNQETFQLNSAYENGIKDLSTKEILAANKTLKNGDYVFSKGHPLRPVEEFLDKTPSNRSDTVFKLLKDHLEGIENGNKKYEAEETASYRRAVEQDFPELRKGLDNIVSQNLTAGAAFKKIRELIDPLSDKYKDNGKVINRLKKLKNDTIRNADLIRKANDSDLLVSINGFLNEKDKSGNTFGELLSVENVKTIDGISSIIKEHPDLKEKFEALTKESLFDNKIILNRIQSELLKNNSVYNNFVDAYSKDRKQILKNANEKYGLNYKGTAFSKTRKEPKVAAKLIELSNNITDNAELRKQADKLVDMELGIFTAGQPRKTPEDPTIKSEPIEIEVGNVVRKSIKLSIPKEYEGMIDVANISEIKASEPVTVLNKKGREYLKGLPLDQQIKVINDFNKFTIRAKQIVKSATSPNQPSIPGSVTRGEVQVGDKALAGERFDLSGIKPRQPAIVELEDRNRAEYIESGKRPFDMSTSKVLDSLSELRNKNPQYYSAIEQLAISRDQLQERQKYQGSQKSQINYITENISKALNNIGENALNVLPEGVRTYVKGLVDFWSNAITPSSQGVSEAGATESSSLNPSEGNFDFSSTPPPATKEQKGEKQSEAKTFEANFNSIISNIKPIEEGKDIRSVLKSAYPKLTDTVKKDIYKRSQDEVFNNLGFGKIKDINTGQKAYERALAVVKSFRENPEFYDLLKSIFTEKPSDFVITGGTEKGHSRTFGHFGGKSSALDIGQNPNINTAFKRFLEDNPHKSRKSSITEGILIHTITSGPYKGYNIIDERKRRGAPHWHINSSREKDKK